MPKQSKKTLERMHFKGRVRQRYGMWLDNADVDAIIAKIEGRDSAKYLGRESCRKEHYLVQHRGNDGRWHVLPVVYDCNRRMLVTVIPRGGEFNDRI